MLSRKRIVAALLLVVAFSLGAACYLQLTRAPASELAAATPAPPATAMENVEPAGETASAGEALHLATIASTTTVPATDALPAPTSEESVSAADSASEVSRVTMETVDMPANSIVLASAADGGEALRPHGSSARFGGFRFGGGLGGFGGGGSPGSNSPGSSESEGTGSAGNTGESTGTPSGPAQLPSNSQDPDDSNPPVSPPVNDEPNEGPQNNDEGEGSGEGLGEQEGEQPPLVNEPPGNPPYSGPDPRHEDKPVSVPEPSTLALLGAGLAALGLGRRRRSSK